MNERKLTKAELNKREDIIMKMKKNKRQLVKRYGKDAEKVMYGRATQLAKKQAEAMDQERIKEMVKAALMGPMKEDQVDEANAFIVAADAARDAGKKEFEFPEGSGKMHPVKIKTDIDELDATEKAASDKIGRGEEFTDDDAAAVADKMPKIKKDTEFKLMGEEDLDEDLDLGHQDNEPHMLKADLYRIGKYAMELYQMVDRFEQSSEEVDFPHWWQSKVIKAKEMLVSAKHYLDFEVNEPQIDAMVDVAQDEEVIDEVKSLKDLVNSVSKKGNLNDVIARAKDMAKEEGLDFSDEEIERAVENSFDRMMGLGENAFIAMMGANSVKDKDKPKEKDEKDYSNENLKEGTWSLGTAKQIVSAINSLEMLQGMDAASIADSLEDNNKFYYNVIGDDLFHDALDRAERSAGMGDMDRAQNGLFDAVARAEELLAVVRERESSRPYKTDIFNEVASKLAKQLKSK